MNLSGKNLISFEDFYTKFYKSNLRSLTMYPPQRAIVTVAKKAETQKYAVTWAYARSFAYYDGSLLSTRTRLVPLPKLAHTTTEQEFRNVLESLGLKLTDGEFESAWKK